MTLLLLSKLVAAHHFIANAFDGCAYNCEQSLYFGVAVAIVEYDWLAMTRQLQHPNYCTTPLGYEGSVYSRVFCRLLGFKLGLACSFVLFFIGTRFHIVDPK